MVATAPAQRVRQALDPVVGPLGLVLEHVEVTRAGSRSVVRVVVDLAEDATGELDLDRVAEVTRVVSDTLDEADAFPGHYTLEVSTPGVSRPMTQRRHFVRAIGRTVEVQRADGTRVQGRLQTVGQEGDGDVLVLVPQVERGKGRRPATGNPVSVPLADVRVGHVQVDLSGLGQVDERELTQDEAHEPHDVPETYGQQDDHTDEHGTGAAGQES